MDVVPACCHVATEFVCVWFLPVLPRRSLLFFADPEAVGGEAAIPVRLSLKSLLFAYARPILIFWAGVAATFPFVMFFNSLVKPGKHLEFLLFAAAFFAVPCLALVAMRQAAVASPRRRSRMAEIDGLPPPVVANLRRGLAQSMDVTRPDLPQTAADSGHAGAV